MSNQATVNATFLNYFTRVAEIELIHVLSMFIKGRTKKAGLRGAIVGVDEALSWCLELFSDQGISFDLYAGNTGDIFRPAKDLATLDPDKYDVVLISDQDGGKEQAFKYSLKSRFPEGCATPIIYYRDIKLAFYGALLSIGELHSCLNPRKLVSIALGLMVTKGGVVVECGTFRGGTSVLMGKMLRGAGDPRPVHTCDTFEGMPAPVSEDGETIYQANTFTETSLEFVQQVLRQNQIDNVTVHKGLVQDVVPNVISGDTKVSFGFVDTDQYAGTKAGLFAIVPRLASNGIIIVDDSSVQGVDRAIEEAQQAFPGLECSVLTTNFVVMWRNPTLGFMSSW